jgi:hypothetical protein
MKRLPILILSALAATVLHAGGYGLGLQTAVNVAPGQAVVPRVDYLHSTDHASAAGPFAPIDMDSTADILALGADYEYYFRGRSDRGPYVLGGLGVAFATLDVTGSTPGASNRTTSHQTRLYPEVGAGWQFNRYLGLELLYRSLGLQDVTVSVAGATAGFSYPDSVDLALTVRF